MVDDMLGTNRTLTDHTFDPSSLNRKEIPLPHHVRFDMWTQLLFHLFQYSLIHGGLHFASATDL